MIEKVFHDQGSFPQKKIFPQSRKFSTSTDFHDQGSFPQARFFLDQGIFTQEKIFPQAKNLRQKYFNPLIPAGNKRSYVLAQIRSF